MFEQVRQLLAHQFEVDENTITMDTNIADDLGADSLDVVELVMSIEDAFGITIEDEKAAELTTVRQVVDYLEERLRSYVREAGSRCCLLFLFLEMQ